MTTGVECILHIGHTKTGSTSIQRALAGNRASLLRSGILYPKSPGWDNHVLLPASVAARELRETGVHPGFWEGRLPGLMIDQFSSDFAAELASVQSGLRAVVMSSEQCIHMLPDFESVTRLHSFLHQFFRRVVIVVYLRRQDEHVASAYTQLLRDGLIEPPAIPDGGPRQLPQYDYAGLLWRWSRVFGEENTIPRIFEHDRIVNGDVVDDFLSLFDAAGTVPTDDPSRASNPSANVEGQALMLEVGRMFGTALPGRVPNLSDPTWRHFTELVTELMPGKGWRPAREESLEFLERFRDGNEWIRQRWFESQATLFRDEVHLNGAVQSSQIMTPSTNSAAILLARLAQRSLEAKVAHHVNAARLLDLQSDRASALAHLRMAVQADEHAVEPKTLLGEMLALISRH